MSDKLKDLAIAFAIGLAIAFAYDYFVADKGLREAKVYADSVAVAADARESVTTRWADSLRNEIVWLQSTKAPVTVKIVKDSTDAAKAAKAVAAAQTAHDSAQALVVEVASLVNEVEGLKENARTDSLSLWTAMARGDSLQNVVHDQSRAVADLNARIQALHPKPTLALKLLKGTSYIATAVIAYEAGKKT